MGAFGKSCSRNSRVDYWKRMFLPRDAELRLENMTHVRYCEAAVQDRSGRFSLELRDIKPTLYKLVPEL